jgi:hypothetical protein
MKAVVSGFGIALLVFVTPFAHAAGRDSGRREPYPCNPQKECLARAAGLKGAAAEAAKRDCGRMPTSGTCFGAPAETPGDRSDRGDRSERGKKK